MLLQDLMEWVNADDSWEASILQEWEEEGRKPNGRIAGSFVGR